MHENHGSLYLSLCPWHPFNGQLWWRQLQMEVEWNVDDKAKAFFLFVLSHGKLTRF